MVFFTSEEEIKGQREALEVFSHYNVCEDAPRGRSMCKGDKGRVPVVSLDLKSAGA